MKHSVRVHVNDMIVDRIFDDYHYLLSNQENQIGDEIGSLYSYYHLGDPLSLFKKCFKTHEVAQGRISNSSVVRLVLWKNGC